jgi:hypothetical protein
LTINDKGEANKYFSISDNKLVDTNSVRPSVNIDEKNTDLTEFQRMRVNETIYFSTKIQ